MAFAAISFYWGSGGTLGLDTIGGSIESMGRAHDPIILVGVWVTGFMKVLDALFALALVSDWGTRLPRRLIAILGWAAAAVLTLYGGSWVLVEALVANGMVRPAEPVAWKPLLWHLCLGHVLAGLGTTLRPRRLALHLDHPRFEPGSAR